MRKVGAIAISNPNPLDRRMSNHNVVPMEGKKFGKLHVVERAIVDVGDRGAWWRCACDCGGEVVALGKRIRSGAIRSCGCLHRGAIGHGHARKASRTGTYESWGAMKARCLKKNHKSYQEYGGRGIRVCDRWLESFDNFLLDMGERPEGTTLDRYPNCEGNYEPGNCRWATPAQQNENRSITLRYTVDGKTLSIKGWEQETGIPYKVLYQRLYALKWAPERAMKTPATDSRWHEETRDMRRKNDPRCIPVRCEETGQIFYSASAAARWLVENGHPTAKVDSISKAGRGDLKTAFGYRWTYLRSDEQLEVA